MSPIYRVPVTHQQNGLPKNWHDRACGIAALAMIMEFFGVSKNNQELLNTGLEVNAYIQNIGWSHKGLVAIAQRYGLRGTNYDWAPLSSAEAFRYLEKYICQYPIICSAYNSFDLSRDGHFIAVVGIRNNRIYYNDPDIRNQKYKTHWVSKKRFLNGWKRRCIVIYP